MDKKRVEMIRQQFDQIVHQHEEAQVEYWLARDLMPLLGYDRWENFDKAIARAEGSCAASGIAVSDHFREVTKMVALGSGSKRSIKDYMLTRYACYLVAQNGDPKKEEIAFAQSYFALQTRKQELIEERIAWIERTQARGRLRESEKRLSQNIYERGVDRRRFWPHSFQRRPGAFRRVYDTRNEKPLGHQRHPPFGGFFAHALHCSKKFGGGNDQLQRRRKGSPRRRRYHRGTCPEQPLCAGNAGKTRHSTRKPSPC